MAYLRFALGPRRLLCRQCAYRAGEPATKFVGITHEDDTRSRIFGRVLCESCGPCTINHLGEKVDLLGRVLPA